MCATTNEGTAAACRACGLSLAENEQAGHRARVDGTFTMPPPSVIPEPPRTLLVQPDTLSTPLTPMMVPVSPTSLDALVTHVPESFPGALEGDTLSLPPTIHSAPPLRQRGLPTRGLFALCAVGALGIVVEPILLARNDASPARVAARSPRAVERNPVGFSEPPPEPTALPAGTGEIRTSSSRTHHRIFVDRRLAGQTPASIVVPCGAHTVRIGSTGATATVDVPCGGAVDLAE